MSTFNSIASNYLPIEFIVSKIKRDLKSFVSVNLIDENDIYENALYIIKKIGNYALKENEARVEISNYSGYLPPDYSTYYDGYLETKNFTGEEVAILINKIVHTYKSKDVYECCDPCKKLDCEETVTLEQYVPNINSSDYYNCLTPLRLSGKSLCSTNSSAKHYDSNKEISIVGNKVKTNFETGVIYIQYYGIPVDEQGVIMVRESEDLLKAVEWYCKYQLFSNLHFDGSVPNLQQKVQDAKQEYLDAMAEAKFDAKLPTFATMINMARNKRNINITSYFSS